MKKLLGIVVLGLLFCSNGFSVEPLKENQKGKIKFQSIPTITLNQFLRGETEGKTKAISGTLKFPKKEWTKRLPAVVLLHGAGGPRAGEKYWSKELRKIGLATFVVDSNSTRGCPPSTFGVCKNYSKHQGMVNIVDAYRALEILSTHPRIDPARIAVMGFSVGGKASLYSSVKRFQKMWGNPGLEFAAYLSFYPACNITFNGNEDISDNPIRIFYGKLDEWSTPISCTEYVNRLRKTGKDITITIYPGAHHSFDHRGDATAPTSIPIKSSRINCQFVEETEYDNLVVLEKDKNNSELENLYNQCTSIYPNRKKICRLNAYMSLKTSNIYSAETYDYFSRTINMKEKLCNMSHDNEKTTEDSATEKANLEKAKEKKEAEEAAAKITLESDKKYAVAVEKFIKKEWGESDWEIGFIQCMAGYAPSLSKEVKEAVIEHGPEKAFKKISNQDAVEVYSKVFSACEKNSEAALKVANEAKDKDATEQKTSSETSSSSITDLPTLVTSLENQLVKQAEYYETMSFFLSEISCVTASKRKIKYNKKAATKVKKTVTDFFISTFEITPL
jgi:dienelactone hydrolase